MAEIFVGERYCPQVGDPRLGARHKQRAGVDGGGC
jgi:hypothetical protein